MSSRSTVKPTAPTMVFDLDGTLVDSIRDLVPALNRTIAREGLPPVAIEHIHPIVSHGSRGMIKEAFRLHNAPLSDDLNDQLFIHFMRSYEEYIADHTVFFDGCIEALTTLADDGWKLAVCTNKYGKLGRKLLDELGELHRFSTITGGDTFDFRKPDPRHLLETIKLANGDPRNAIMVGDSISDIDAAKNAGIPVIAVDFGYTDIPVEKLNPDAVISHFNQLISTAHLLLDLP